eukprot:14176437-Heterocapsa_arctica.AAC.1
MPSGGPMISFAMRGITRGDSDPCSWPAWLRGRLVRDGGSIHWTRWLEPSLVAWCIMTVGFWAIPTTGCW